VVLLRVTKMATSRDYYELLRVSRDASGDDLKRAYRKLAVKYHPDRNPDDHAAEETFKALTEAYAVLSDPDKRRRYDVLGPEAFASQGGAGFGADVASFGDILEGLIDDVFGKRDEDLAPKDLRYNLKLSFREAALGVERRIEYTRRELCERCQGARSQPGASAPECPACRGRGRVRYQRSFLSATRACSACAGTGVRLEAHCRACHGKGTCERVRELSVKLPAGVLDGAVRSVRGEGEHTPAGKGDLHVHVSVEPHPLFTRDGADLVCEIPVSFPQAALGGELEVPTLEGRVTMKLPPGTQSGKVFRLRGKGLPALGGVGKGDQLVTVVVEVPEHTGPRERELLEQLASALEENPPPRRRTFLDKLKKLFD
jgi:molecular chaperone DnaJ